jgi:hemolysin activation/secretion protein
MELNLNSTRHAKPRISKLTLALLAVMPAGAIAQVPPPPPPELPPSLDPGQVLQRGIERVTPPARKGAEAVETEEASKPDAGAENGLQVLVKSFKFEDFNVLSLEELNAATAKYVGKELTFTQLRAIAREIQGMYRAKGYSRAQVVLPKQDVTDGIIIFRAIEGRFDKSDAGTRIEYSGKPRISERVIKRIFNDTLGSAPAISDADLERATLLLNDLPGGNGAVTLAAGASPGESRVVVKMRETPTIVGNLTADNTGNRYTGSGRLGLNASINSPLQLGDQLSISALTATNGDFDFYRLAYSLPLDGRGAVGTVAFNEAKYAVGKELASAQATGSAKNATFGFKYPIQRLRGNNIYLNIGLDLKWLEAIALGEKTSDKEVDVKTFGVSGDFVDTLGGGGVNNWSLSALAGDIELNAPAADSEGSLSELQSDQAGPRVSGAYNKFLYSFTRIQTISPTSYLQVNFTGQFPSGSKNLDNSEKFSIGGPTAVRAYPGGEGAGDRANVVQIELRKTLERGLVSLGDFSVMAFYDYARTRIFNSPYGSTVEGNRYSLKGWGAGVVFANPGIYEFKAYVAQPIGENPRANAGKDSDGFRTGNRVAANLTVFF